MWDLVGTPEDRFSHNEAHFIAEYQLNNMRSFYFVGTLFFHDGETYGKTFLEETAKTPNDKKGVVLEKFSSIQQKPSILKVRKLFAG